jgi:hypothetical protein
VLPLRPCIPSSRSPGVHAALAVNHNRAIDVGRARPGCEKNAEFSEGCSEVLGKAESIAVEKMFSPAVPLPNNAPTFTSER